VASQSNGTTVYHVVNGECSCKDFAKAPSGWCKHRIAYGLMLRTQARLRTQAEAQSTTPAQGEGSTNGTAPEAPQTPDAPTGQGEGTNAALPEAPVSITLKATLHGHEVLVTLRGTDFASVKAQVEAASQWLQSQGTPAATDDTPRCQVHGVPMVRQTNAKGAWWSHKTATGWCKGK
jgi:hypothetical protein